MLSWQNRRRSPLSVFLISSILLGGCHLIFRYEDDPNHGRLDSGSDLDGPIHDSVPRDQVFLEAPPPPPDIPLFTDGLPPPADLHPPDGTPLPPDLPTPLDQGKQPTWWVMNSGTKVNLHDVFAISTTSVFAVGDQGIVLHYDGNSLLKWTTVATLSALGKVKDLRAVHGLGNKALIMGRNNADLECTPTLCDKSRFRSLTEDGKHWSTLWCDSPADCFVGGLAKSGTKGYLMRLSQGIWWNLCSNPGSFLGDHVLGLTGLPGSNGPTVYASGLKGKVVSQSFSIGCKALPSTGVSVMLNSIWTISGAPLYAVGETDTSGNGTLLAYDGTSWVNMGAFIKGHLRDVWGSSKSDVWVVGDSGFVTHFNGTKWHIAPIPNKNHLYAVHGNGPNDIYAVGKSGTILRFN